MSVIIPMYNAENFIAEGLESILAQTFRDFEVIVVDDCSTDNSRAVVESYLGKFDGRLKIFSTEKNSGSGALPRNKGMSFSRGEYIFFMDNDDLITPTALEELYTLAKDFDADVVQCEKNYQLTADSVSIQGSETVILTPKLEPENLAERVQKIFEGHYNISQWNKLVRRDLIFENELFFPNTRHADDMIWTWGLLFLAKRFLYVPNLVYIQRLTKNSITRKERTSQQKISFWLNPLINGLKTLDNFMSRQDFFRQNPQYRCALLENFIHIVLANMFEASRNFSLPDIYEIIRQEYGKSFGENDLLTSFLLADLIEQQKIFVKNIERIAELEKNK